MRRKRTIRDDDDDDDEDDNDAPTITITTAIPRRPRTTRSSPTLLNSMTQPPEQPLQGLSSTKPILPMKNVTSTPMMNSTTNTSTTLNNSHRRRDAQQQPQQPQSQLLLLQQQQQQQPTREAQPVQQQQQQQQSQQPPPTVLGVLEQKVMASLQTICENITVATLHSLSTNDLTFVDLSGSFLPPMDFILEHDELQMSTKIPMFPEDFPPNQPPWPLSWWGIVDPVLVSDPTIVDTRLFQTVSNSRGSGGRRGRDDDDDDPQGKSGDHHNRRGHWERP